MADPILIHHEFMRCYYWPISWVAVAVYLSLIFFGSRFMKKRTAFNLQRSLIVWNFSFFLFSTVGLFSIMPEFFGTLYEKGLESSYCFMGEQYHGYNGEWVWLFHASKLVELGDTVFIVLRKKPINFYHWYHHSTVLLYASYSYRYGTASCRWGIFMNLAGHSILYMYFAFATSGRKCALWVAPCITFMQIWQFFMGFYISIMVTYKHVTSAESMCQCPMNVSVFQTYIYGSYLLLFAHSFYVTYLEKKVQNSKTRKVE